MGKIPVFTLLLDRGLGYVPPKSRSTKISSDSSDSLGFSDREPDSHPLGLPGDLRCAIGGSVQWRWAQSHRFYWTVPPTDKFLLG